MLLRGSALQALRDLLLRLLVPFAPVQHRFTHSLSGIGIRYSAPRSSGKLAGARVPDIEFITAQNQPVHLYELLRQPAPTLIVYLSPAQLRETRPALTRLLSLASASGISVNVVLDAGRASQEALEVPLLVDYKGDFAHKLGARPSEVFLLRPDAYIAFRRGSLDTKGVVSELRRWVVVGRTV